MPLIKFAFQMSQMSNNLKTMKHSHLHVYLSYGTIEDRSKIIAEISR